MLNELYTILLMIALAVGITVLFSPLYCAMYHAALMTQDKHTEKEKKFIELFESGLGGFIPAIISLFKSK